MLVKILKKEVKLQLDSGSDLTIINLHTWRKLNKPTMQKTTKTAKTVTETKIKFEGELITKVTFNGTRKKLKLFVLKNTEDLFATDWIQEFNLWDLPINTFCKKLESLTTEKQKTFPEIFAASLGKCIKTAAKFKLIDNSQTVFKKKRNGPFGSLEKINKELHRLVKTGILSKVEFSQWAAPTVYVKRSLKKHAFAPTFQLG